MTPTAGAAPENLPRSLHRAAELAPVRGIAVFDGRGRRYERRTWPEVLATARRGAARLGRLGIGRGDRVLVCLPTSWEWMEAWLGALLAGALPVAVAPGGALGASEAQVQKVDGVSDRLAARLVVASAAFRADAEALGASRLASLTRTPEELAALAPVPIEPVLRASLAAAPDDVAFLQLTSGSTGLPRAVAISHRAVAHNNRASDAAIGAPSGRAASRWAESMVSWLPLHHDMGLVGCLFMSMHLGLDLWLLPPGGFLARPRLWLEHLGAHGATFAPAPNFGYQLCAERVGEGELQGLDLSLFRAALVGAEMVRPETIAAFERLTTKAGFSREAFLPCYGLAEATLAVTFDVAGRGVRSLPRPLDSGTGSELGPSRVVCVGAPVADTEVRITAPDGTALAQGRVGEVRVQGPGVFAGYWNDPEATAETLVDGWLATGDLGFLDGGELYLTGRTKDLLIVRGHNMMPHELEWVAESVTGGGGVERSGAFSVDRGSEGEQAVLVVETGERDGEALAGLGREIRLRVARSLGLPLADLAFVRRGRIPKTTSGKVQRRELRRRYLAGELERLDT